MTEEIKRIIIRGIIRQYFGREITLQQYSNAIVAVAEDEWSEIVISEIENYFN